MIAGELLKFAESGQLYRGAKPVMWSPVEKTALAEAEVEYEDITSTQIDVAFEIVEAPNAPELQKLIDTGEKVGAVIWTTTPLDDSGQPSFGLFTERRIRSLSNLEHNEAAFIDGSADLPIVDVRPPEGLNVRWS